MRRALYIVLIVIFATLVIAFKFQNMDSATISLFSMSMTLPLSLLVFLIYVLGMLTGGFMLSLLRSWARGAARRP
jgi:putative membrane protein